MCFFNLINEYSNLIIAFFAFLAFLISISQAKENRKHNRISVTPALCDWLDTGEVYFNFSITNNGIGPALIKNMSVFIDGKKIKADRELLIPKAIEMIFPDYHNDMKHSHFNNGYIVAVNEKINIANVKFTTLEAPDVNEIKARLKRVRIVINYESAYGKKYQLDTGENHPLH